VKTDQSDLKSNRKIVRHRKIKKMKFS